MTDEQQPSITTGVELMKQIVNLFDRNGIYDYAIAFADIDACETKIQTCGSPHWRHGIAWDLMRSAQASILSQIEPPEFPLEDE